MIYVVRGKSMRDGKMSVPSSVTQLQINLRIIIGRLPQEPMTHNVKLLSQPPQQFVRLEHHLLSSFSAAMHVVIEASA